MPNVRRRYAITLPPKGDLSREFLERLNATLTQISTDLATLQGFDNTTPEFHNALNFNRNRLCNVGRTRDDDDAPSVRELRDRSVFEGSDGALHATRPLLANRGIQVPPAQGRNDVPNLEQTRNLAATTPPAWVPNTPAQITANQNDYALGGAVIQRLSTDASRNITGFVAMTNALKIIVNSGANNLVLQHQNASSSAANRLINQGGADLTLTAEQSAIYWYDTTTGRWRQIN